MLIFSGIALFVAAFIIYNTFSILVARRTRELALLRALGAHRGQIRRAVLGEALVVGLVAATVGIVFGIGVALLLKVLLGGFGLSLPGSGLVFKPATVGWSLLIGVGMTTISALAPSRRSGAVAVLRSPRSSPCRSPTSSVGRSPGFGVFPVSWPARTPCAILGVPQPQRLRS